MIYFLYLFVILTKNLLFSDILDCIHFLKFNSSINLSFFARRELSTYIKGFNSACISKSSHSRAARSFFLFDFSKRFSSFIFCIRGTFWIFWSGYPSPHFLIVFINWAFSPTLTYSNVFLFINVFSPSFKFSASPILPHLGN